ncbi:MAG: 50S ribosomal protein L11 methyltransferase [Chitinophagaceae bacterium]|nr:50S ribosomal protein L11 methyltransferase [Chitinophagaceae bacterium]MCB9047120.1 50S ribosomal protein L11 methyltransferase [Chitinophagales bacterium]
MKYIQASFETTDATIKEVLVAHLAELGFDSFDENSTHLHAYIPQPDFDELQLQSVTEQFDVKAAVTIIEQENWNAEWEKAFEPVKVGDFCTIRATFHEPDPSSRYDIIITPKMSFGTGHHATTQLMVRQMQQLDFNGKRVFDFGCGTGILAILAEKLGAGEVIAVDNDEWSYENAAENLEHNLSKKVSVSQGSIEHAGNEQYDIILANINRHILIQYMKEMKVLLKKGGTILMSGLLSEDEPLIVSEASKAGFIFKSKIELNNWICLSFS